MNRTVKDAAIKAFHYPGLDALKARVLTFITAYNFAKHLKALRWRTPFQAVCDAWTKDPAIFKVNPHPSSRDYTIGAASLPMKCSSEARHFAPRLVLSWR